MNKQQDQPPPYSATSAPNPGVYQPPPYSASAPFGQQPYQQQSYYPPPPAGYVPNYGATTTNIVIPPTILTIGGCPACRVGVLEDEYTCPGLLCAILFFPIGILCCLAMKTRCCSNCGAYFG